MKKALDNRRHLCYIITIMNDGIFPVTNPKNGLTFYVQATDQDHANRIAVAMSSKEEETSQNIEDDFRDMMPTSEEFYAN